MKKDLLFLLSHDFEDRGETYYCPGCVELVGLLETYPKLKETVEIRYVDFPRPRPEVVDLLGEENQSCPVLVLAERPSGAPARVTVGEANGQAFVEGAREIGEYWAHVHGIGRPH